MLEKCGHPDLNIFTSNESPAFIAIEKIKILGAVLKHCKFNPFGPFSS
jgi:hypothetical protein